MASVFTYGSLVFAEVWELVAGRLHRSEPALLAGYRRRMLHGAPYPGISPATADDVDGVLWHDVGSDVLARLDDFEGEIYERRTLGVTALSGPCRAEAYVIRTAHESLLSAEHWQEERFRDQELERYLEGCARFANQWDHSSA